MTSSSAAGGPVLVIAADRVLRRAKVFYEQLLQRLRVRTLHIRSHSCLVIVFL